MWIRELRILKWRTKLIFKMNIWGEIEFFIISKLTKKNKKLYQKNFITIPLSLMAARRLFVGGNWKCNNSMTQTRDLINNVLNKLTFDTTKVDVIVSPISIQIPYVHDHVQPSV